MAGFDRKEKREMIYIAGRKGEKKNKKKRKRREEKEGGENLFM